MTVRDLYRVLTLSPKSIEVQFYDEQCNEYDSLYGIEEYEVLYIKDWQAGTHELTHELNEQYNPFNNFLRLSIVIAPPKAVIEHRNAIDEIYNLISSKKDYKEESFGIG